MTINIRGISKVFQKAELDKIPKGWTETVLGEVAEPISQTHDFLGKDKIIFINTGNILAGNFYTENIPILVFCRDKQKR